VQVRQFPGRYVFKNILGEVVEPTDLELDLYNESRTNGIKINNQWLTFMGGIQLIGFIILVFYFLSRM